MRDVDISTEPIELYKLLKLEGFASTGGEAKMIIADGKVTVNGTVETQKRKKIMSGDIIEIQKEKIRVTLEGNT